MAVRDIVDELKSRPSGPWESEQRTHPLPVAASWCSIASPGRFGADWSVPLLQAGRPIVPTLPWAGPSQAAYVGTTKFAALLKTINDERMPVTLRCNQPILDGTMERPWVALPEKEHLYSRKGRRISPFGRPETWPEVARRWTQSATAHDMRTRLLNVPWIMHLDNNEVNLLPSKAAQVYDLDPRLSKYGGAKLTDDQIRNVLAREYTRAYKTFVDEFRTSLIQLGGSRQVVTSAYDESQISGEIFWYKKEAWNPANLGCLYNTITKRFNPWADVWGGSSPPYYLHDWQEVFDDTLRNPRFFLMTQYAIGLKESFDANPNHFVELCPWDGGIKKATGTGPAQYPGRGQTWSPERYRGFVQWGMWISRPQIVREFRAAANLVSDYEVYSEELIEAVESVWNNPVLRKFWRNSTLVANPTRSHPLWSGVPAEVQDVPRMFLLECSTHPSDPWRYKDGNCPVADQTSIPVWALARKLGDEYLLFVDAPTGDKHGVTVDVPGAGKVVVDAPVGGAFYKFIVGSLANPEKI